MAKQQLLLIGHGMVGQRYLESLVAQGGREQFDVTVLCEEPLPAYDRVGLTSYFSGKTADDTTTRQVLHRPFRDWRAQPQCAQSFFLRFGGDDHRRTGFIGS